MKIFSIRPCLWAVLLCAPAPALLTGCSGGFGIPRIPTIPVALPQFALQNGQLATLNFEVRNGKTINGTLSIADGSAVDAARHVPPGDYPFTGTFSQPRSFQGSSTLGTAGTFTLRGNFPTSSQTGSYTATFLGETTTGVLPVLPN